MNVAGEVDMLEYARSKGLVVVGETCPQYLFFTESDLEKVDAAKWICSPPLRKPEDNHRIWRGLKNGTIQVLATDHCPFYYDGTKPIAYEGKLIAIPGKELGKTNFTEIPNGLPGVGDRIPVMWTKMVSSGEFTPSQFVALTSTNPAKIFGLFPKKGVIQPGSDADIVLWDPEKVVKYGVKMAHHRTDYNLYEGLNLTGYHKRVISRGKTLVDDGEWFGQPGDGRFIHRLPFSG
jgi:dihydropyrimidinase